MVAIIKLRKSLYGFVVVCLSLPNIVKCRGIPYYDMPLHWKVAYSADSGLLQSVLSMRW